MIITAELVKQAVDDAMVAARNEAEYSIRMDGEYGVCGFAWVVTRESGTSRVVRLLKKHGFRRSYRGGYVLWNPSGSSSQSMAALKAGADAAAKVLTQQLGVTFTSGCEPD